MPSSTLILGRPLLLLPTIPPSIRVFSNESTLHMRWPKYWSFSFSIITSKEHPGLISFRMDWLDLLAVQGTLKSLLQHHSSKASILQCSAFFTVQLSHPYMTTGKTIALTRWTLAAFNFCSLRGHSVRLQGKPFNITVIQVYAPTSNAEEAEVEWFYEDLQNLLEVTPKKDILFIIGDWNAKVRSQETPGVTGKFGIGIWNEGGQRLIEFCQENTLVIANTLFQQHERRLYTWT